ncbi:MAG: glycerol kinase [Pseudomonadota bacterium]|jgi:glycerol kinase
MSDILLAIDQGTTGSTAAFFDRATLRLLGNSKVEFPQHFPTPGWVEHDGAEIWESVLAALKRGWLAAEAARPGARLQDVAAIGITNQRETVLAWNRRTGELAGRALVWQDRRTADFCADLGRDDTTRRRIHSKTGLVCDPYFSASKMRWIVANQPKAQEWSARGELALGTIDCYIIFRLTAGARFVTDHTNASRTMLYNLATGTYDDELVALFGVPRGALPEIVPSAGGLGVTRGVPGLPDGIPITGCLGDQQAALCGHEADSPGEGKVTYGTGAFYLLNTGEAPVVSNEGLLTSVGFSAGSKRTFVLEGSTFIAGAAVQFLRDNFKWFDDARLSEGLALSEPRDEHVLFVPALAGLGAPYWNPHAKGALLGLTRGTSRAQITRAVLESIALQIVQLNRAMARIFPGEGRRLGVDGGATRSNYLMQFQADVIRGELVRPGNLETTAKGAARAARLGLAPDERTPISEEAVTFRPQMPEEAALRVVDRWLDAVAAIDRLYGERRPR